MDIRRKLFWQLLMNSENESLWAELVCNNTIIGIFAKIGSLSTVTFNFLQTVVYYNSLKYKLVEKEGIVARVVYLYLFYWPIITAAITGRQQVFESTVHMICDFLREKCCSLLTAPAGVLGRIWERATGLRCKFIELLKLPVKAMSCVDRYLRSSQRSSPVTTPHKHS